MDQVDQICCFQFSSAEMKVDLEWTKWTRFAVFSFLVRNESGPVPKWPRSQGDPSLGREEETENTG